MRRSLPVKPNVPFYAAVLDALLHSSSLRPLRQTHAVILTAGVSGNSFLRSKLAACYAAARSTAAVHDALLLFSFSDRRPVFLYNSLLRSLASLRLQGPAFSLFQALVCGGGPDRRFFVAVLGCCFSPRLLPAGKALHGSCVVRGLLGKSANDEIVVLCNSLISMYSESGDVESAWKVFDRMPERRIASWTAMMGAYGLNGHGNEMLALFERMLEAGVRPDKKAMMVVLGACAYNGLVEMGWKVFGMMDGRFGVRPGVEHYTAMIGMLGRVGLMDELEELVDEMEMEVVPDEVMWRVLVGACKMHGRMDVVERVMDRMYWKNIEREAVSNML